MSQVDIRPRNCCCDAVLIGSAEEEDCDEALSSPLWFSLSRRRRRLSYHSARDVSVRTISIAWGTGIIGSGGEITGGGDSDEVASYSCLMLCSWFIFICSVGSVGVGIGSASVMVGHE